MNEKKLNFLNMILPDELPQDSKLDRLYAVLMYMVCIEKSITVEDATSILDGMKSGKSLKDLNIL